LFDASEAGAVELMSVGATPGGNGGYVSDSEAAGGYSVLKSHGTGTRSGENQADVLVDATERIRNRI